MTISRFLQYLDEAIESGAATQESKVIALVRNTEAENESDGSWREIPVVGIELDEDKCDFLVSDAADSAQLDIAVLQETLKSWLPAHAESQLYIRGIEIKVDDEYEIRIDLPIIAVIWNAGRQVFGVTTEPPPV